MAKVATHDGTVTNVTPGTVTVQLHVVSACASCEAHSRCGFADSKDKTMDIDTPQWQQYHVGDHVTVAINANRGLQAVLIAYILPALLLLATFAVLTALHLSEGWVALVTLLVVGLYAIGLYLCRQRLQRQFTMAISQKNDRLR